MDQGTRSITVSIAAHYEASRVPFLITVLQEMEAWDFTEVSVTIVTNDLALAEQPALRKVISRLLRRGFTVEFDQTYGLEHPFHLTWWHKEHLRRWAKKGGRDDDLFIYIEDDIAISAENLKYFVKYLQPLKDVGLIPAFILYEKIKDERVAVAFLGPQLLTIRPPIRVLDTNFVIPKFPYWAGFALDRDLCREYLKSPMVDRTLAAVNFPRHTCRVHSALGLCYSDPPGDFESRYALPVEEGAPRVDCQVWHAAQNYSTTKKHSFATVKMRDVFLPYEAKSRVKLLGWKSTALLRRGRRKAARELARILNPLFK
jgi:hypothetical protein